jgi:uncharacterized membrane protein YeaQ/YmgE (transglycosylase-associated protein family)
MLFALLLVCVAFFVVLPWIGATIAEIVMAIVLGFLLGALARLVAPGSGRMGLTLTTVAGVAGALIGGTAAEALDTGWVGAFLLQLLAAVLLVLTLRRSHKPRKVTT